MTETTENVVFHDCSQKVTIALLKQSVENTEGHIADIKSDLKETLKKINGLPVKVQEQDKSIGRLWKFIYVALGSAGAAIVTAIKY